MLHFPEFAISYPSLLLERPNAVNEGNGFVDRIPQISSPYSPIVRPITRHNLGDGR